MARKIRRSIARNNTKKSTAKPKSKFRIVLGKLGISLLCVGVGAGIALIADDIYEKNHTTQTEQTTDQKIITELQTQISVLKETNAENKRTIATLNAKIKTIEDDNKLKQTTIDTCNTQIDNLKTTIDSLQRINTENEETISEINAEIESVKAEKLALENDVAKNQAEIEAKDKQITSLQNLANQLQTTNDLNVQTINSLNAQITSLNAQITTLTLQVQNNTSQVDSLNKKINELQESVDYYEKYIASLENEEQVVATFEYDGSVYNLQVLAKNGTPSITNPTSTDYVKFNYWMVDGVKVDPNTYTMTTNTRFVANVTYYHDVIFNVDNAQYDAQIVESGTLPTLPDNPTKDGYEFDGWSKDGVNIVDPLVEVSENVTYVAMFTKLYNVTYIYDGETLDTQSVRNGEYADNLSVESTTYKVFNGWLLNGVRTDVTANKIISDTTYVADITYYYDVYYTDGITGEELSHQIVIKGGHSSGITQPTKDGYRFNGYSLYGDLVNPAEVEITQNTTFVAEFVKVYNVTFSNGGTQVGDVQVIDESSIATIPTEVTATSETYNIFRGWSVDGGANVIEDPSTYAITEDTEFEAVWAHFLSGVWEGTYSSTNSNTGTTTTYTMKLTIGDSGVLVIESDFDSDMNGTAGYYSNYSYPLLSGSGWQLYVKHNDDGTMSVGNTSDANQFVLTRTDEVVNQTFIVGTYGDLEFGRNSYTKGTNITNYYYLIIGDKIYTHAGLQSNTYDFYMTDINITIGDTTYTKS